MISRYSRPEMSQLWSEERRWNIILEIELLVAEAQARRGEVSRQDVAALRRKSRVNVPRLLELEKTTKHDVIAFLTQIEETVGPAARALHRGLTSSDVLDTALAVQLKEAGRLLLADISTLKATLHSLARKHAATLMAGRTHGVHAEPITFGLKVAGWYAELCRNEARFRQAVTDIARGKLSGAVGTLAHLSPAIEKQVCEKLGLKPEPLATQVIPRDRHAHFLQTLALIGAGAERISLEIRHLQRTEVLEVEEPFTPGQKGSSAMPHKRNPILSENLCGLSRLLRAYADASLENIPLWHERDISHSSVERVALPDATILLDFMLARLNKLLEGLQVYPDRMRKNLDRTAEIVCSQKLVIALTQEGLTKQQAYERVQTHAQKSWVAGDSFRERIINDPEISRRLSVSKLNALFSIKSFLRYVPILLRRALGGPLK